MSTKYFISTGKDGYVDFKDCEYVVDQHSGLILQDVLKEIFDNVLDAQKTTSHLHHHKNEILKIINNVEEEKIWITN